MKTEHDLTNLPPPPLLSTDRKTTRFREMLRSPRLEFLMEAHNGLSARIVEEAGFKGIWASGLSISAALGVRDNNEASWTQVLEVVEFMSDAAAIPILLDGDTGYGNFNNTRRLVQKLEQRGVAAVCIEDKLFPKTNSFINGDRQPLADLDEFRGKITAAKDAQSDPDFCIVARTEAFIAGWGLDEALHRADAYHQAGADAILVHSKKTTADEVLAFIAAWDRPCPVVIVPTTYYSVDAQVFERAGVSVAIWANHNLRAAITAMQETTRRIFTERSVRNVEDTIVSVRDVFRLQKADELERAEERYLPKPAETRAIVLAASRGDLGSLTADKPKAMVNISGQPLLHRLVRQFRDHGVRDITIVRGYRKEQIDIPGVLYVDNDEYEHTWELASLSKAFDHLEGDTLISFGDILFRKYILTNLLEQEGDIVIVVDSAHQRNEPNGYPSSPHTELDSAPPPADHRYVDYVRATRPHSLDLTAANAYLEDLRDDLPNDQTHGEWIGLIKATAHGSVAIRDSLRRLGRRHDFPALRFKHLFQDLLQHGQPVSVMYITGHWLDVDNLDDLTKAQDF